MPNLKNISSAARATTKFVCSAIVFLTLLLPLKGYADSPITFYKFHPDSPWFTDRYTACNDAMIQWNRAYKLPVGPNDLHWTFDGNYCRIYYATSQAFAGGASVYRQCADGSAPNTNLPSARQCGGPFFWSTDASVAGLQEQSCPVGNPVFPGTGTKAQEEQDFVDTGPHPLSLKRSYRSLQAALVLDGFGKQWMHQWARRLILPSPTDPVAPLTAIREDGTPIRFEIVNEKWVAVGFKHDSIERKTDGNVVVGWEYLDVDTDNVEVYDPTGRLLSVTGRNGWAVTLTYSEYRTPPSIAPRAGMLINVRNRFGRSLGFNYDAVGRITKIVRPDSVVVQYEYDPNGMLSSTTWPDGSKRTYHYEDSRFLSSLTGITDEAGVRFATYAYDAQGRAISSERAGGVGKAQLQYLNQGQTSVTSADGSSRSLAFELVNNVLRPTAASAPCPECGNLAKTTAYDGSGSVSSRVDFDNKETRYSHNALGRETQRIEGYGTADAKITTTEWHPTWNRPLRVTRPGQIDTFTYDSAGQLLSHAWYASDDPNGGKGLQAVPTGPESSTVWIYNNQGLVAKATDMLNGVAMGEWTFSYDSSGQLLSLANDYGRVGNVVSREAGGRITEAVNTDGQRVRMQYDAMGRLKSRDVDGVVTTYSYNEMGLLTAVQGAANVMFEYDAAHRLTAYLLPEGQTMQVSDISNPFVVASSLSSSRTAVAPQESLWTRAWSTVKRWLGSLIGNANAQSRWIRWPISPPGPSQSRGFPSSSSDADILEEGAGSRQWPDPVTILATQIIEKGIQAVKEAICGSTEPCPPCRTVTGRIVALGTIAYRPLDTPPPGKIQHGIEGPHYNIAKANQSPRNSSKPCWCFWQSIGAVRPEDLPANAIPIEHFAN